MYLKILRLGGLELSLQAGQVDTEAVGEDGCEVAALVVEVVLGQGHGRVPAAAGVVIQQAVRYQLQRQRLDMCTPASSTDGRI